MSEARVTAHIPDDWTTVALGEVALCTLGGTPSTEIPQFWGGPIPWMASGDVHLRRIDDVPGRITAAGLASSNATLVSPPAVAIGLAGQGKTRGTVALTLCELATNQSIALVRGNPSQLQTEYLFHALDRRYEELRARSSGGGRGGLSKGILDSIPVDLPPLAEQEVITAVLDTLDTTIHQTEAIIAKLKLVKQGLLHDLLTRGIDANGELRPPQSEAPHLYKASPLGWIPVEWSAIKLGGIASLQRGHDIVASAFVPGPYPVISSSGTIGYHNIATATGPNIVIGRKGSIGSVHYVKTDFWAHDTSLFVTNFFGNNVRFVGHLFAYLDLAQYGTKSGSPSLNRNDLHPLDVSRPPVEEQLRIVDALTAHGALLKKHEQEFAKLVTLKSGLMDDLLTGRVRVTPLLNQEVTT